MTAASLEVGRFRRGATADIRDVCFASAGSGGTSAYRLVTASRIAGIGPSRSALSATAAA